MKTFEVHARSAREAEFHDGLLAGNVRQAADKYYSVTQKSRQFFQHLLEFHGRGKVVLEYGCGLSGFWYALAGKASSITGIDISSVAIERANEEMRRLRLKEARFLTMNAEEMEFADSTFDLIFGLGILHHLDLERSFRELSKTLKPDGTAIFMEPLGHNPLINLYRRFTPEMRTVDEHPLLMKDLELAESYFGMVEVHFFHFFSLLALPLRRRRSFSTALEFLDKLDAYLFRACRPAARYAWIVVLVLSKPKKGGVPGNRDSPRSFPQDVADAEQR